MARKATNDDANMPRTIIETYQDLENKIQECRKKVMEPLMDSRIDPTAQERLKQAFKDIKQVVDEMKDWESEKGSCANFDARLITLIEESVQHKDTPLSYPLFQLIVLKLMIDAYDKMPREELGSKPGLLMYGWRCRLLSLLMYDMRDDFKQHVESGAPTHSLLNILS